MIYKEKDIAKAWYNPTVEVFKSLYDEHCLIKQYKKKNTILVV